MYIFYYMCLSKFVFLRRVTPWPYLRTYLYVRTYAEAEQQKAQYRKIILINV